MEPDAADLVEQLKNNATALWLIDPQDELPALMNQAAKEIERLRAGLASPSEEEVRVLVEVASEFKGLCFCWTVIGDERLRGKGDCRGCRLDRALAALRTTKEGEG